MRGLAGLGVVVTGGARGIGLAIAKRFAREGSRVFICDRDEQTLTEAAASFPDNSLAGWSGCDVGIGEQVVRMAAQARQDLGEIDVLINNAGIASCGPFLDVQAQDWDEVIRVNLGGCFLAAQAIGKQMVAARRGGVIVNISSTNGLVSEVGYAAYNASKAGLLLLSQTMAVELAPYGVRVNAVCPGYIVTPMSEAIDDRSFVESYVRDHIPLGRTGTPEDVASACAFLASPDSAFITGTALTVDGGQLAHSGNR